MNTEKKKRGRPPKRKTMEFEGMTYEGAINNALDKEVRVDDTLVHKSEDELTDDEHKYLKRKREKKSYPLNVRFTESEMQDILAKCEQYGNKNKTEYIHDCVRARVDLTPDRTEIAETNRIMNRIGANINQILVRLYSTGHVYAEDISEIKRGVNEIWHHRAVLSLTVSGTGQPHSTVRACGAENLTAEKKKPSPNAYRAFPRACGIFSIGFVPVVVCVTILIMTYA